MISDEKYFVRVAPGRSPEIVPITQELLDLFTEFVARGSRADDPIVSIEWYAPGYYIYELIGCLDYNRSTPAGYKYYGNVNIYAEDPETIDLSYTRVVPMSLHDAEHICSCIDDQYIHVEDF